MHTDAKKILVLTQAYNAEKTLYMAIDSVLNQTYENLVYYVIDNGSTDTTREIIREYTELDSRVRLLCNDVNVVNFFHNLSSVLNSLEEEYDYFAILDADDEYLPNFLEKSLAFAKEENLDIVCSGHDYIDAASGKKLNSTFLPENLILDNAEVIGSRFTGYVELLRNTWGKLYSMSAIKRLDYEALSSVGITSGSDQLFTFTILKDVARFGILKGVFLRYYYYPKSAVRTWYPQNVKRNRVLYDAGKDFLLTKCGSISIQNEYVLQNFYLIALELTLETLKCAQVSEADKLAHMHDLFVHEYTRRMFDFQSQALVKAKKRLTNFATIALLTMKESYKPENAKATVEIILALYRNVTEFVSQNSLEYLLVRARKLITPIVTRDYQRILETLRVVYNKNKWLLDSPQLTELEIVTNRALGKPDSEIFELLLQIRKKCPNSSAALDIDTQICKLTREHPLLKDLSISLIAVIPQVVLSILRGMLDKALDAIVLVTEKTKIDDSDIESFLLLGQNIAAAVGDSGVYIYYKKVWINQLIEWSRFAEAGDELNEFMKLLPEDEDFIMLRQRLDGVD